MLAKFVSGLERLFFRYRFWVLATLAASPLIAIGFFAFERWYKRHGGMPILQPALLQVRSFRAS